jgi:hypothetical protein
MTGICYVAPPSVICPSVYKPGLSKLSQDAGRNSLKPLRIEDVSATFAGAGIFYRKKE